MPRKNWQLALKAVVDVAIDPDYVEDVRRRWSSLRGSGPEIIAGKLFEIANYQGMSDRAASSWLSTNGSPDFQELALRLPHERCECVGSVDGISGCGYLRSQRVCSHPALLASCIVPTIPARKGQLSRLAVALSYWAAQLPNQSLGAWVRSKLKRGDHRAGGAAMVEDLKRLPGVSDKVASMIASDVAIGLSAGSDALLRAGASVIVVDRLVHNLLIRTGAVRIAGRSHAFGLGCYAEGGCRDLIVLFARGIDARQFNRRWPTFAPRMLQHAIWRLCAGDEMNICNGNNTRADAACGIRSCPAFDACARVGIADYTTTHERQSPE